VITVDKKYKNWDITKGDYERLFDNPLKYTEGYKAKARFRKIVKISVGSVITLGLIAIIIAALA
jgi:uncharacterized membrane protein